MSETPKERVLHLDQLTASVALADLAACGNDLVSFAQSIDEDWKRFAPKPTVPPGGEARHFISTMTNRQNSPPTGHSYFHTQLIQPDHIPAEERDMKDRFLKGQPFLTAEIQKTDDGYRLETAILRMGIYLIAVLDWAQGHAIFYVLDGHLPETLMTAAPGCRLGQIVNAGHCEDLMVREIYVADMEEVRAVVGQMWLPAIAIRTDLPGWDKISFTPVFNVA